MFPPDQYAGRPAKGNSGRGALIWTGRHIFALPHLNGARYFSLHFSFSSTDPLPTTHATASSAQRGAYIYFYHSPPPPSERNPYPNYTRIILLLCKINLCIVLSRNEYICITQLPIEYQDLIFVILAIQLSCIDVY